jgi:hypothetical protein
MPRLFSLRSATLAALSLCLLTCPATGLRAADDSDANDVIAQVGDSQVTAGQLRAPQSPTWTPIPRRPRRAIPKP